MLPLRDQGITIADAFVKAMLESYPKKEDRIEVLRGARDLLAARVKEIENA